MVCSKCGLQVALVLSLTVLEPQGPTCHADGETTLHVSPHSSASLKLTPGTEIRYSVSLLITLEELGQHIL